MCFLWGTNWGRRNSWPLSVENCRLQLSRVEVYGISIVNTSTYDISTVIDFKYDAKTRLSLIACVTNTLWSSVTYSRIQSPGSLKSESARSVKICGHFLTCFVLNLLKWYNYKSRSQWPSGLRRVSTADRLLGLWVRIAPGAWMSVSCKCCMLSVCDWLITRPEESYRLWFVLVCDLGTYRRRI